MAATEVTISTDDGMPVVVAHPGGSGPHPSVLLTHERFGLVEHTLNKARRLASYGYVVACPNLFYRHPDQEALHAAAEKCLPGDPEVTEELEQVAKLIARDFDADLSRMALIGFCQTGRYPIIYAASHEIRASVTFYGGMSDDDWATNERNPHPFEAYLDDVNAPILAIFAEQDPRIPIDDVRKLRDALERRNKSYQISIYNGMPHGWLNETIPERYRAGEAERAWGELLAFLQANVLPVGGPPIPSSTTWIFRRV